MSSGWLPFAKLLEKIAIYLFLSLHLEGVYLNHFTLWSLIGHAEIDGNKLRTARLKPTLLRYLDGEVLSNSAEKKDEIFSFESQRPKLKSKVNTQTFNLGHFQSPTDELWKGARLHLRLNKTFNL